MSLHPVSVKPVPPETSRIALAAFPHGNLYMTLRDELGTLYSDGDFADLFPTDGRPAQSPWRLAWVCVMQFMAGLSDRAAAEAVASRIDWKYALSLELTDSGFDFSVLSEFRSRLIAGSAERRLLDQLLAECLCRGIIKDRGKQRTDSTHVLAAIGTLNRLECVGEKRRTYRRLELEATLLMTQKLATATSGVRLGLAIRCILLKLVGRMRCI